MASVRRRILSALLRGFYLEQRKAPDNPGAVAVGASDGLGLFLILAEGEHKIEVQVALATAKLVRSHGRFRLKASRRM
jgi:hypothetical protein